MVRMHFIYYKQDQRVQGSFQAALRTCSPSCHTGGVLMLTARQPAHFFSLVNLCCASPSLAAGSAAHAPDALLMLQIVELL